jgi:carbonic anhydrase
MKTWEVSIIQAMSPHDFAIAGQFILDYLKEFESSLGDQDIEREVAELDKLYSPPNARLFLLQVGNVPAGCVIVKRLADNDIEMKRMYIDPRHRGHGYSQALLDMVIGAARNMGGNRILLDLEPSMKSAIHLYEKNGFKKIPAYHESLLPNAMFYELKL